MMWWDTINIYIYRWCEVPQPPIFNIRICNICTAHLGPQVTAPKFITATFRLFAALQQQRSDQTSIVRARNYAFARWLDIISGHQDSGFGTPHAFPCPLNISNASNRKFHAYQQDWINPQPFTHLPLRFLHQHPELLFSVPPKLF
jgi:hypothetical protein